MYFSQEQEDSAEAMQCTQLTQPAGPQGYSEDYSAIDARNCWGWLEPVDKKLPIIPFTRPQHTYYIGRCDYRNDYVLMDLRISNKHCAISWNGREDHTYVVRVHDDSMNGTFINGRPILNNEGNERSAVLRDGDIIAFATPVPPRGGDPSHTDNRYVYHHMADQMIMSMTQYIF